MSVSKYPAMDIQWHQLQFNIHPTHSSSDLLLTHTECRQTPCLGKSIQIYPWSPNFFHYSAYSLGSGQARSITHPSLCALSISSPSYVFNSLHLRCLFSVSWDPAAQTSRPGTPAPSSLRHAHSFLDLWHHILLVLLYRHRPFYYERQAFIGAMALIIRDVP